MSGLNEVKNRIKGVHDTQKITNALYLVASAKLRKAKGDWERTKPYFLAIKHEIKAVFRTIKSLDSIYFYPENDHMPDSECGYLVITADKGMAGAYNNNVIKSVEKELSQHKKSTLYVIGDLGREYFSSHGYNVDKDFKFNAYRPTLSIARKIAEIVLEKYKNGVFRKLFVVYTDSKGQTSSVNTVRVLPFHGSEFFESDGKITTEYEFEPSPERVLENIIPSYVTGFIYSAFVDSFCAEQTFRLNAMKSADDSAKKMLEELNKEYNYARQSAITTSIIEVSSGAKYSKNHRG